MINMTKPGIGSEKTEIIPVKAKRAPNTQLRIKPTEIFLLGFICSLIVFKLVNKKCQNFPYFYFFTKENCAQRFGISEVSPTSLLFIKWRRNLGEQALRIKSFL